MSVNKLAFPFNDIGGNCDPGMTYRQWLAGLAMQGLLQTDMPLSEVRKFAVEQADALISELEKNKDE